MIGGFAASGPVLHFLARRKVENQFRFPKIDRGLRVPGYYIVGISVPNPPFLNPTVPRETLYRSSCIKSSLSPEFLSVYTENRTTTHSQAKYA
jgi:hypothetical protein